MKTIEKDYLENRFVKPIMLVTYDGDVLVKEKIKVFPYGHRIDKRKSIHKLDVLFAFSFEEYDAIKVGIKRNKSVAAQKLQPIVKIAERPHVATKQEYRAGERKFVKITMRSGHILSGKQICDTQYDLLVRINEKIVLVYKHGILVYQIEESEGH